MTHDPRCALFILLMIPAFLAGGLFGQWRMGKAEGFSRGPIQPSTPFEPLVSQEQSAEGTDDYGRIRLPPRDPQYLETGRKVNPPPTPPPNVRFKKGG